MSPKQVAKKAARKAAKQIFSAEERAAMKEYIQEQKGVNDESAVVEKIAGMPEPDRSMARKLHRLVKASAPDLSPRLWYGMPAYSKGEKMICFFQPAYKFKARYGTLGFSDKAALDEGALWPVAYALGQLSSSEEAKISALVKKAAS